MKKTALWVTLVKGGLLAFFVNLFAGTMRESFMGVPYFVWGVIVSSSLILLGIAFGVTAAVSRQRAVAAENAQET